MNTRFRHIGVALALAFGATQGRAASDWTFATIPADGAIAGPAGSTIGWGYTIANLDPLNWLSLSALSADLFAQATPTLLFDFPVLAPLSSVTVDYAAGSGLFEITWDTGVTIGHVETGQFLASADWYDADPFGGGTRLAAADDIGAAYSARVAGDSTPLPLPSTLSLLAIAVAGVAVAGQRTRAG